MRNISNFIQLIDSQIKDQDFRGDAYQLLADRLGLERNSLRLHMQDPILPKLDKQIEKEIDALVKGRPLHRILGYRYFWKDKFYLTQDTLEPRPDSEILIETCIKYKPETQKEYRILDLGTGSGCLLLSLLREYPKATGLGVDISEGALEAAKKNAASLGLAERATWVHSSWLDNVTDHYDIIISNPPYIPSPDIQYLPYIVKTYDPLRALDGGWDGLSAYRQLSARLQYFMQSDTLVILEIGFNQEETVSKIFTLGGYIVLDIVKDYGGNPRCLVMRKQP